MNVRTANIRYVIREMDYVSETSTRKNMRGEMLCHDVQSKDVELNAYSRLFLDLCIFFDLSILNRWCNKEQSGSFTFIAARKQCSRLLYYFTRIYPCDYRFDHQ